MDVFYLADPADPPPGFEFDLLAAATAACHDDLDILEHRMLTYPEDRPDYVTVLHEIRRVRREIYSVRASLRRLAVLATERDEATRRAA